MPKNRSVEISLLPIVKDFVDRLSAVVEERSLLRARAAVMSAFERSGIGGGGSNGALGGAPGRPRRKPPIQLCPVPGCQNRAAPVFGMVCADHKDVPKPQIRKYREARRKRRANGKGAADRARR